MLEDIAHFSDLPSQAETESPVTRALEWTHYLDWPAVSLRDGDLELFVVPSIGGRLMGMRYRGEELNFVNASLAGRVPTDDPDEWAELCGEWAFPLWGGGKTWVAPESRWPDGVPHRDLDSGAYKVLKTWSDERSMGIELESPICEQSGLQIFRRITLEAGTSSWSTLHRLTNRGSIARECGIWDVLMLNRPARVDVTVDSTAYGVRDVVAQIAGKGPIADLCETDIVRLQGAELQVECDRAVEFKLGIAHATGDVCVTWPAAEGARTGETSRRYRRQSAVVADAEYAHGTAVEVFNAPSLPYFEVETHAPLARLKAEQSVDYTIQEWVE
jgi:hypothetical protein